MPNQAAPFDALRVRDACARTRFGDVRYVEQTASTNADAQSLLGSSGALGATLVADYQSAGVGRKGRRWLAPPGSALLFTTLLPEPLAADALWAVPFWAATSVAEALESLCGVRLDLVWPNDGYAGGRKIVGILSVARISADVAWAGCGVGLNVVRPVGEGELDALVPPPAFLSDLAPPVAREAVLTAILQAYESTFARLRAPREVAERWEERARLAGTVYRYTRDLDGVEREGVAVRIGEHGELVVRDASGEHAVDMADVRITGRGAA